MRRLVPVRAEGHHIIVEIAEQYLQPDTTQQVRALLAIENDTSLGDVANWADEIHRLHSSGFRISESAFSDRKRLRRPNAANKNVSIVYGTASLSATECVTCFLY